MKRMNPDSGETESRGIKSIEVGYRVLVAVQRGPGAVPLSEIAKRAGLSTGAAHNYIASLRRTGLVEQDGRGLYRLGPSAFALSVQSFQQLNGYDLLRAEALALYDRTGQSTAVSVWSQAGPVSVFVQRSNSLGMIDFRPGLVPMFGSGAGMLFAAYLEDREVRDLLIHEAGTDKAAAIADRFIADTREQVLPQGYAFYSRPDEDYYVLAAPVWLFDRRIAFVLSLVSREERTDPAVDRTFVNSLLESAARAATLLAGTTADGPKSLRG